MFFAPDYKLLKKAQGYLCFYCGKGIKKSSTRDHFFPKSWGRGIHGNVVLACSGCNGAKGDCPPTPDEILRFHKLYNRLKWPMAVDVTPVIWVYWIVFIITGDRDARPYRG